MNIWIISQHNMPPEYGHLNRHYNLAKYLERQGHSVKVFVGSYLHNTDTQMISDNTLIKRYDSTNLDYYFIKTIYYKNSSLKRLYSMFQFYRNVFKAVKMFDKPDVIIGSSSHPLSALAAVRLGKRYKCQAIVEIRDLWPESFIAYNIMSAKNPLINFLYKGERWLYENGDKVIFTMEGGSDYIVDKGWDVASGGKVNLKNIYHLNNGVDLEVFNKNKDLYQKRDPDLDDSTTFKVVYTGSIRLVNNVKRIVDIAAEVLALGESNIKFLIYGEGPEKPELMKFCKDNNITNVVFKGNAQKKFIPGILVRCDLNILHFQDNQVKKYGSSMNKMFDYFASGKPTLSDSKFGYDVITKFNCGRSIDKASVKEMASEVVKFKNMEPQLYQTYCDNAIKAARHYDFKKLSKDLVEIIEGEIYE